MRIHHVWAELPQAARGGLVALGNFDGVHRGHDHLLRAAHAARPELPLGVLTFEPHPREFFRPDDPPFRLSLAPERAALLEAHGVAELFQLPFDAAFSNLTAEAFVTQVLHAGLGARHVVCGADFAFGHRRGGDAAFLTAHAGALGIGITVLPKLADEVGPVSSTRIRRLLQDGYPERAAALLGRPWAVRGPVTHGDKRGRTLGFPTANVPLGRHLEPARGVYAVLVTLANGSVHGGVANIGLRPTVNAGPVSRLEVHLFEFHDDLYDTEITVALLHFLRGEQRFAGLDALRDQIAADATHARHLLDQGRPDPHSRRMSDKLQPTSRYRDTVFLPRTPFPMRGDLPKREPAMLARWAAMDVWGKLRASRRDADKFILHDGPPYANGHLHIGHALNKILKDVVNRAHQMAGQDAEYIPGWDCHGLPIEWKIEEEYRKTGRDKDSVDKLAFRAECRAYAAHWMAVQSEEFQRLGVCGDWRGRYATMDFASEAAIADEIGKFLLNGALYRGLRPVMWSPVEKTALAEAEVEYHDHTSTTVFVRFPVIASGPTEGAPSVVIWTTTPWTMPGNRAIAYGEAIDYALVRVDSVSEASLARPGEELLVALALLPEVVKAAGIATHHVVRVLPGRDLAGLVCAHPLRGRGYDFDVPLLPGDHVTADQGTGFVHTAPTHGEEDFALVQRLLPDLTLREDVAPDGTYEMWVPIFAGLHVYKAAGPVCAALTEAGGLLAAGKLVHSYPHSWRSKAPLITRATPQWFIRMDGPEHLREQALAAIDATRFVPDKGRNRIGSMVASRPDWCISRQRAWGVPIPVFVDKTTGVPLRDPDIMARIVAIFREEGADAWYASPPSRFLGNERDPLAYEQVFDIVDVWFESGSTHAFTLEARGLPWPADLYLEGSDQHRGWFQSSLLEAVGTRGRAPFKAILTHGFTLDEQGRKMSKSLGNVVAPQEVSDQYGADILRLWVMNTDTTEDQRLGADVLKQTAELYRRLRNTLRWLLGALDGFSDAEIVPYSALPGLERLMLHRLSELDALMRRAVETHDWSGVYPAMHTFCAAELSAFYFDVRKDSLYCDRPDHPTRRAARTVLDQVQRCLTMWLAPVLVFTAEEAWIARFGEASSVHLETFPDVPLDWRNDALVEEWNIIRTLRGRVNVRLEEARRANMIRSSLEAAVAVSSVMYDFYVEDLAPLLIVSEVTRLAAGDEPLVTKAPGTKCERCWRVLPEVGRVMTHATLCLRCADAVDSGLVSHSAAA